MDVWVGGVYQGKMAAIVIYHTSQNFSGSPQVAVLYANGFIRLKQNANPSTPIPFGTSFLLGPAYWRQSSPSPFHNPQINRLDIDTTQLENGPLVMSAQGTNHDFAVSYDMTMPPPQDRQTRIHVNQTYMATTGITIDAAHRGNHEGFKLVQASSMFIPAGVCVGYSECHDSNSARYIGQDLLRHEATFTGPVTFFFGNPPQPLSSTWLDILHTDDQSWQGNTPNERIALDYLPTDRTITPQGNIEGGHTKPADTDNVGVWLHDDGLASVSWSTGQTASIGYWLIAQDNPPDPWADLGLRSGLTLVDFDGISASATCNAAGSPNTAINDFTPSFPGYTGNAAQIDYDLGTGTANNNNYVQIKCVFSQPVDLSAYDHLRFDWRGSPTANPDLANSLEVGIVDSQGNHFDRLNYRHAAHHTWWTQLIIPFSAFEPFDHSRVSAIFFSIKKIAKNPKDPNDVNDIGGTGLFAIDNVSAFNAASRSIPGTFENVTSNTLAAQAAADWLARQQQTNGSLKSWFEEPIESPGHVCLSHTYDQALGLIVFSKQGMWREADKLADRIVATQNIDGSWYQTRTCSGAVADTQKWSGAISWTIYALSRYRDLGGTHSQAGTALQRGSDWLVQQMSTSGSWIGCLKNANGDIDGTEANIDAWWALQATGNRHAGEADQVKGCLIHYYWNDSMGRFNGGNDATQVYHVYLDNQTWGAAFLKAIGESNNALRALSFARDVLGEPAQGGQLFGFDGNAGPWSVWNEGTAQYIAVGGGGAKDLLQELLAQQEKIGELAGSMPGSPDDFRGSGVWTTHWHGVAPTAWLYFALTGEPFQTGNGPDTTGVFRPSNGALYLKNRNETGFADIQINYGLAGDYPVVGDWDGNGTATIGIYRNGSFYLRNSNTIGFADMVFAFGAPGDQPIAGDWNRDGVDTIGVYRSSTATFYLRNNNTSGTPDMTFALGIPGDVGLAGDWDGDGFDTTGVFRPSNGALYLKNFNRTGIAEVQVNYGLPGDRPVTGDWNNDGIDTIGVYRNGQFMLRNSNTIGFAEVVFALGIPGDIPIAGDWDGIP
jgi:hypothetical protein